jgi:hypothetical protein
LHAIYGAYIDGQQEATDGESAKWTKAAAENRIKTRKQRGSNFVKVWIENSTEVVLSDALGRALVFHWASPPMRY